MPELDVSRSQWPGDKVPNFVARPPGVVEATGAAAAALATDAGVADVAALLTTQAGYLDGLETKLDALNTVIGVKSDAAWDGSAASASLIAIMKAIWVKLP